MRRSVYVALLPVAVAYQLALRPHALASPRAARCTLAASDAAQTLAELPVAEQTDVAVLAGPQVVTSPFTLRVCGVLGMLVGICTVAFALLERWSFVDSLYFTTTTLATIGFGDLRPSGPISRALTAVVGMSGVGLLGGLVSAVVGELWSRPTAARGARLRRLWPPWAQAACLLSSGVCGVKLLDWGMRWVDAVYLVVGTMTTAGLGDVVPQTAGAKLFISLYSPLAVVVFARVLGELALRPLEAARGLARRKVLER